MTFLLWLVLAVYIALVRGNCPPGWEHRWNKCYYFSTESHTWDDALRECHSYYAHLAEVHNKDEDAYFRGRSISKDTSYWIGLTDEHVEGHWEWLSGMPLTYTNWHPGEPDNVFNQDYGLYYPLYNNDWVSGVGWITHSFICEKDYPAAPGEEIG